MADYATRCRTANGAEDAAIANGMAHPGTGGSTDGSAAQRAARGKQQGRCQRGEKTLALFHDFLQGAPAPGSGCRRPVKPPMPPVSADEPHETDNEKAATKDRLTVVTSILVD